jgi:hypothetical protein
VFFCNEEIFAIFTFFVHPRWFLSSFIPFIFVYYSIFGVGALFFAMWVVRNISYFSSYVFFYNIRLYILFFCYISANDYLSFFFSSLRLRKKRIYGCTKFIQIYFHFFLLFLLLNFHLSRLFLSIIFKQLLLLLFDLLLKFTKFGTISPVY